MNVTVNDNSTQNEGEKAEENMWIDKKGGSVAATYSCCSLFALFSVLSMFSILSILSLNSCVSILSLNSVGSVLSTSSMMSIQSSSSTLSYRSTNAYMSYCCHSKPPTSSQAGWPYPDQWIYQVCDCETGAPKPSDLTKAAQFIATNFGQSGTDTPASDSG